MGKYINKDHNGNPLANTMKDIQLIASGATVTDASFKPDLVCVVDNVLFQAAAYCDSEAEFRDFNDPNDKRPKTWLIVPNAETLVD